MAGLNYSVSWNPDTEINLREVFRVLLPLVVAFGTAALNIAMVFPLLMVCVLFLASGIIDVLNFGIRDR